MAAAGAAGADVEWAELADGGSKMSGILRGCAPACACVMCCIILLQQAVVPVLGESSRGARSLRCNLLHPSTPSWAGPFGIKETVLSRELQRAGETGHANACGGFPARVLVQALALAGRSRLIDLAMHSTSLP